MMSTPAAVMKPSRVSAMTRTMGSCHTMMARIAPVAHASGMARMDDQRRPTMRISATRSGATANSASSSMFIVLSSICKKVNGIMQEKRDA